MGLESFTDILVAFTKTADPQVVVLILILTFVLLRAVWMPYGYSSGTISLASLLIAVPVTFVCSAAEETMWGGRFFWSAVVKNGSVSVMMWYVFAPQVFTKWPGLLKDEMISAEKAALVDKLQVLTTEERARTEAERQAARKDQQEK